MEERENHPKQSLNFSLIPLRFHLLPSLTLLLLLLQLSFSQLAVSYSTIKSLPGFHGSLPFELETGYVGVDESDDVQLFYYFVKSERNPKQDPIVLWLTGGPGCSALTGLAYEIGPLYFEMVEYDGSIPTLVLNPYSWTKVANIIFLDLPVGTGFSYSRSLEGAQVGDFKSCEQAYQFLRKWLIDHPEFLLNPTYIGGDSYSGKIVPLLVLHILNGNEAGIEPFINFKGYLLGNPVTDPIVEDNTQLPYAHGMGLISNELYEAAKTSCGGQYAYVNPSNVECLNNVQAFQECISGINSGHILEPKCNFASPRPMEMVSHRRALAVSGKFIDPPNPLPAFGCRDYGHLLSYYWANDKIVRKALHIREGTVSEWIRCNYDLPYTYNIISSIEYHVNISKRGYRSLLYSGDHDLIVTFLSTQAWIRSLNYSIVDEWRSWLVDGQIGGYTRTYSNGMTFATVKGGGHTAPEYQPKECFAMFKRWIYEETL